MNLNKTNQKQLLFPSPLLRSSKRVRRGDDATAGGLNGITYKSLKIWFLKNDLLADKLTELLNQIAAGDILEEGRFFLNSSRGVGLPKDGDGTRPKAIGHILLRLTGSLALSKVSNDDQKFFQPQQFGVGTKNGVELLVSKIVT